MHSETDEHIGKIIQHLAGELTRQESTGLLEWKAEHPDNEKLFDEITRVWEASAASSAYEAEFNSHADWKLIEDKLEQEVDYADNQPDTTIRPLGNRFWRNWAVAAAIALLVAVGIALLLPDGTSSDSMEALATSDTSMEQLLADGSVITLNAASSLQYPPADQISSRRNVNLEGEAFFDVAPASVPFIVETQWVTVKVTGTSFNVRALAEENTTVISVSSGQVDVYGKEGGTTVSLNPGDKAVMERGKSEIQIERADPNDFSWKTGVLVFADAPIEDVLTAISRHFRVPIRLQDPSLASLRYQGRFDQSELSTVLEAVSLTLGLDYQQGTSGYILTSR